jgi:hypothetical protein
MINEEILENYLVDEIETDAVQSSTLISSKYLRTKKRIKPYGLTLQATNHLNSKEYSGVGIIMQGH